MVLRARTSWVLLAFAGVVLPAGAALADAPPVLDIVIGTHVTQLGAGIFVDPSCPTGDGVRRLWQFERFIECMPDDAGLRTIAFRHDDTAETEALARRNAALAGRTSLNMVGGAPAAFAFDIDAAGRLVGYTVTAAATPAAFAELGETVAGAWACAGPAAPGPQSRCSIEMDGARYVLDWIEPADGQASVTLAVSAVDPAVLPAGPLGLADPAPDTRPRPPFSGRLAAFLAGASTQCPGCDLADADLRWRDLSGADLTNADLEGAVLHGSSLAGADLTGARLGGANLNRTDLTGAVLRGADLASASIFAATAAAADFTGAGLSSALVGNTNLSGALFDGASLDGVDLGGAVLDGASLFFATLRYATLEDARFAGADLRGAILSDALATGAVFAGADLSDATLARTDLRGADFVNANLTNVDFVDTLIEGAGFAGAITAGTDFTGAAPALTTP
ncbi:MAG: pentapeptide repeat-containing protein [Bauldia sp.]|nr:pentapeptide repeat-containing protein [Bauldia sp.]MCW5716738.1 pentapeptide repeat-containing protein [Bauldia sp.]